MREILFRGKQVGDDEWIEGYVFPQVIDGGYAPLCITTEPICANDYSEILGDWAIVDSSTVGQCTGLTDKNGKKIFEGDCFKTYCAGLPVYKHIVGYYPEHFAFMARCIEMNTVHYLSDYRSSAIEVIGNVYDNPELLEVTE